jgi:hypothetical protein
VTDPLDPLSALNREEWADKPYLIEMQGGEVEGRRFRWHDLPLVWRQPLEPPPAPLSMLYSTEPTTAGATHWTADYRRTGSVTDDGAHVYEFDRFE